MFITDIAVVLGIFAFIGAVAIELRRNRDKKMYVGGEAKTSQGGQPEAHMPAVPPHSAPPTVTQEELKRPPKSA